MQALPCDPADNAETVLTVAYAAAVQPALTAPVLCLKKILTSMKSCLASSTPATWSKVIPVEGSMENLAFDLPKLRGLLPPAPPMPPCERLDSRNRPPTSSSGKARLPAKADDD